MMNIGWSYEEAIPEKVVLPPPSRPSFSAASINLLRLVENSSHLRGREGTSVSSFS